MKIKMFLIFCIATIVQSCTDAETPIEQSVDQISIRTESRYLIANNTSTISIGIETNLRALETEQLNVDYYANGERITSEFKTDTEGIYTIWAEVNSLKSNEIVLTARPLDNEYEILEFPVIFHIVNTEVTSHDINQALEQLNRTFRMTAENQDANAVDTFIQFKLAHSGPDRMLLEEQGIKRYEVDPSFTINFEDWMWDAYWDPDHYINIWVGDTGSEFSWATYPTMRCDALVPGLGCDLSDEINYLHGIALNSSVVQHRGRNVLSHEMGHFFGLRHIFSYSCDNTFDIDFCEDTPVYNRDAYEANPTESFRESCDNFRFKSWNIMDYYDQDLRISITYDQRKRMRKVLENGKWTGMLGAQNGNEGRSSVKKTVKKPALTKQSRTHIID